MVTITEQARTILGPLTTTFTPPAPCTVAIGLCETCNVAWWGQTCAPKTVQDDPSCWPQTTAGAQEADQMLYGWGFYSPGLICPAGYTSACTAIDGGKTGWKAQFKMEAEETFVGCCPTGFQCTNNNGQTCMMGATSTNLPTVSCEGGSSNNFGFTTLPNANVNKLYLFAPMIQLAWKSTDSSATTVSTTSASSSTQTSLSSTTTTQTPAPDSSEVNTDPSSSTTLSTGAIAGIGVGAAALFFIILFAALFIWRSRRRQRGSPLPEDSSNDDSGTVTTYAPGYSDAAGTTGDGNALQELKQFHHYYAAGGTSPAPSELQGPSPVFEVPAQGHGRVEMEGLGHSRAEMPGQGQMVCEMPTQRYD